MAALSRGELLRRSIHLGAGVLAFTLRFLGPWQSALLPLAGLLFNLLLLPRLGGRRLWRAVELRAGRSLGIIFYPFSVLLLILIFHRRLEVAAAAWGLLAFGDGTASLLAGVWGGPRLPWNREKSWLGSGACWLFGSAAAAALLLWTAPGRYDVPFALGVAAAAGLVAALVESSPQRLDDNLGVPLVGGLALACLLQTQGAWDGLWSAGLLGRLAIGLAINLVLAALAYAARVVDRSGGLAGLVLGTVIWAFLGGGGWALLVAFLVVGAGSTRLGPSRKLATGLAERRGGRRGAANAVANAAVAAACALLAGAVPEGGIYTFAFVGSLAAAAADTAESEIGLLWGGRPVLITSLRPVPPGTDGGVTLMGTGAGLAAAALVAASGWGAGLIGASAVPWIALAGLLATAVESVVGATIERRGLLDNHAVNFVNTLTGALLGAVMALPL